MALDDKDRKLLSLLRIDGRMRNNELAQHVGLSPSACLIRVRRLEESGVIAGYRAVVGAFARGAIEAWIDVRLTDGSPEADAAIKKLISDTAEACEAYKTTGASDYVVHFCAADVDSINAFKHALETIGGRAQVRLTLILNSLK